MRRGICPGSLRAQLFVLAGLLAVACAGHPVTPLSLPTSGIQEPPTPTLGAPVPVLPSPTASPQRPVIASPSPSTTPTPISPPVYGYRIVNAFPHDTAAFTEGLVFDGGFLYESTGYEGQSTLRRTQFETGKVLQVHKLPDDEFGEGLTVFGNKLIQLTLSTHRGYVYDKSTFQLLREFTYPTEGWGITQNGQDLIMSDGTPTLYFLNPDTFVKTRQLEVYDNSGPVTQLNELEYVQGEIYANVWETDRIARIAPDTGQVLGWIDLKGLLSAQDRRRPVDVLNGIAYDAERNRLFVTGKLWPRLFQIELVSP